MKKDPALLFYPQDFLTGTMHMTNEEKGIYIVLLCMQHQHGAILDKNKFNRMVGDFESVREKFEESEEGFYNKRLMEEIEKRSIKSNNMSENAKKRWDKDKSICKSNAIASAKHMQSEDEDESIIEKEHFFNTLWSKYPKKVDKKMAYKSFKANVKSKFDFDNIETALDNYISYIKQNDIETRFIKHGKTFFNNWQDSLELDKPKKILSLPELVKLEKEKNYANNT